MKRIQDSSEHNSVRKSKVTQKLIANVFLPAVTIRSQEERPSHKKLAGLLKTALRERGIVLEQSVDNGRVDLVAKDFFVELKSDCTKPMFSQAVGQTTQYGSCLENKQRVIAMPVRNKGIFAWRNFTPEMITWLKEVNQMGVKILPMLLVSDLGEAHSGEGYMSAILASAETGVPLLTIYDAIEKGRLERDDSHKKRPEPKIVFSQLKKLFGIS